MARITRPPSLSSAPSVHPALRDQSLRRAFQGMLDDDRLTRGEAEALLRAAQDGPGLSSTEQRDLEKLVEKLGDRFDTDARRALEAVLGGRPTVVPAAGAPPPGEVTTPFATELAARISTPAMSAEGPAPEASPAASPGAGPGWWEIVGRPSLPGLLFEAPMLAEVQVGAMTLAEAELLALLIDVASVHVTGGADSIEAGGFLDLAGGRTGLVDGASFAALIDAEGSTRAKG